MPHLLRLVKIPYVQIKVGETIRLKPEPCPVCKMTLDAATILTSGSVTPDHNSFTVCVYCAATLRFEMDLKLKVALKEDLREMYDCRPDVFAVLQKLSTAAKVRIQQARRRNYRRN